MVQNRWTKEVFEDIQGEPLLKTLHPHDYQYHQLIYQILLNGLWKENRTGVKTLSIFGPQVKFEDVGKSFPLLTTKRIHLKSVIGELLWFLSGSTNKHELRDKYDTTIWDEWGDDETGELGPVYGHQWVNWSYYEKSKDNYDSLSNSDKMD